MDLLLRYGDALGAEDFVETRNVCGTVTATRLSCVTSRCRRAASMPSQRVQPDSEEIVAVPKVRAFSSHLQLGFDPHHPAEMGVSEQIVEFYRRSEAAAARMGVQMINTCTPYQVGNVPTRGEHLAWMESSAVVYANSVLGARTNTEGRESTSAAMLTCRIPNWGFHLDEGRRGTLVSSSRSTSRQSEDWGLFGYWMGDWVQERVPVVSGVRKPPNLPRLKHFGAAASSSGGVEMFIWSASRRRRTRPSKPSAGISRSTCGPTAQPNARRRWRVSTRRPHRAGRLRDARLPALHDRADLGSGANCSKAGACTTTARSGSSRRARSRRWPTATATRRPSKPQARS